MLAGTTTTTHDAHHAAHREFTAFSPSGRGALLGRGSTALAPADQHAVSAVVRDAYAAAMEEYIRACPSFEGEILKRMLRDVAHGVARAPGTALPKSPSVRGGGGGGCWCFFVLFSPSHTPRLQPATSPGFELRRLSAWSGPFA